MGLNSYATNQALARTVNATYDGCGDRAKTEMARALAGAKTSGHALTASKVAKFCDMPSAQRIALERAIELSITVDEALSVALTAAQWHLAVLAKQAFNVASKLAQSPDDFRRVGAACERTSFLGVAAFCNRNSKRQVDVPPKWQLEFAGVDQLSPARVPNGSLASRRPRTPPSHLPAA